MALYILLRDKSYFKGLPRTSRDDLIRSSCVGVSIGPPSVMLRKLSVRCSSCFPGVGAYSQIKLNCKSATIHHNDSLPKRLTPEPLSRSSVHQYNLEPKYLLCVQARSVK
ncbi:hypothetical protein KQX54_014436 [Cotesia glomerata]|uniref:Uncharacterized protein n=1 Tax=Cotesia glomerata TaxID=32391 RepID=A0AAV7HJJ7_COTGL|nr:hypothetical protein KQX54_014436 [Cotesia glomerata]